MTGRIRSFRKVVTEDQDINKLQAYLEETFEQILKSEIIDGVLLKGIQLDNSKTNSVSHKLDRNILGWLVIRRRAKAQIWDTQDLNTFKSKTLDLQTDTNVNVDLWIF